MVYARLCHLFSVSSKVLLMASSSFDILKSFDKPVTSPFKRIVLELVDWFNPINVLSIGFAFIPPILFALAHQTRST